MTQAERQVVVTEALEWQGTPYHANADIKGVGCDCALGPLAIYRATLPRLPLLPMPEYVAQWALHQEQERFVEYVEALGGKRVELPEPGDFALFRRGRLFSHGAIVLNWPTVIHAVPLAGFSQTDASLESRLCRVSRIFSTL